MLVLCSMLLPSYYAQNYAGMTGSSPLGDLLCMGICSYKAGGINGLLPDVLKGCGGLMLDYIL